MFGFQDTENGVFLRKARGRAVASRTIAWLHSQKLRGMRDTATGDDGSSVGVEVPPRSGDDHDRYRQLSAASRQVPPARAAC